jgi:F-box protein 9
MGTFSRFYPNGQVLSLLANEHEDPQHIIGILNLSLRMKVRLSPLIFPEFNNPHTQGLSVGTWHLVQAPLDRDSNERYDSLVYIDNLKAQEPVDATQREVKYHFQMTLSLRSRPLGRWNKLDFVRYAVRVFSFFLSFLFLSNAQC